MARTERDLLWERLSIYSELNELPFDPSTNRDRRDSVTDRRRCNTFLAKDRRSGIADRRKKLRLHETLVDFWRRHKRVGV